MGRGSYRYAFPRPARLHPAGATDPHGILADALDLSRTGVGLRCDEAAAVGEPVRVVVHDQVEGVRLIRQWSGRVAHARPLGALGARVGVSFEWPERGDAPARERRLAPVEIEATDPSLGPTLAVALCGLALDQATKAWAASMGSTELIADWLAVVPASNAGGFGSVGAGETWTAPACGLGALALAAWWTSRHGRSRRRAARLAAGLLAAGLVGNAADRLALGHVRDFLVTGLAPNWEFNLADVLVLAGAAGAAWQGRRGEEGAPEGLNFP
jgi:lipoprotein signal peptidase